MWIWFSEPPDVGNWFSTYEYQSPDPDSNFSLEEGEKEANFERIKARDEVVVREKLMQCSETCVKDDNHEDLCLTKVNFLLNFSLLRVLICYRFF